MNKRFSAVLTVVLGMAGPIWAAPQVAMPEPTSGSETTALPEAVTPQVATPEPSSGSEATTASGAVAPQVESKATASPAAVGPLRETQYTFTQIAPPPGSIKLKGTQPDSQIEFGVRSDELVTQAQLTLHYRPSPALTPTLSQLKIYLNEEMVGLVTVTPEQLGKENSIQLDLDPRFISDFNRIRFELVGHYANVCENPANSTIWLDIGRESQLNLTLQKLPLKNDLSHFPEPFFDGRDNRPLQLPIVFAGQPDINQQRAAAILASWFGVKAQWHGQSFPVLYNQLPANQHAVVFATNDRRPDFLRDLPPVDKPTVRMVSQPGNPWQKMLLILGRNDDDLTTAVQGIAQGNLLLRGDSVTVDSVDLLTPRKAYDAPNWVHTDRATSFAELTQYENQLQADGMQPPPISVTLNLPPDLFLVRARGITMDIGWRYTSPMQNDGSRMAVHLNNQFMQDYPLTTKSESSNQLMHIPLVQGLQDSNRQLTIPALRLGAVNQLRFDFDYANTFIGGTADGRCETVTSVTNHVVLDPNSTIDFSGYRHYIEMPSLRSFTNAGFPFSRFADLAQTQVLMNKQPSPQEVSTLLTAMGNIGAQIGYPALRVNFTDDSSKLKTTDSDLLVIGTIPPALRDDRKINLLIDSTRSALNMPARQPLLDNMQASAADSKVVGHTVISSLGPMAAVISFQSPFFEQRSVVALMADSPAAWQLLDGALQDSGKRNAIYGAASIIRESGVNSLQVGENWYVGYLPWWERLWNALATHPLWLGTFAVFVVVIFALLVWRVMRMVTRRRLGEDDHDD